MSITLEPMDIGGRLHRLRDLLSKRSEEHAEADSPGEQPVEALVVTNLSNVRYLTGFTGSAAILVVTPRAAMLTTDGRYRTQSAEQVRAAGADVEITIGGVQAQRDAVKEALGGCTSVGLEAEDVTWAASRRWREVLQGMDVQATAGLVEALRETKDPGEIARMGQAAAIADAALGDVLPLLHRAIAEQVTEARVALELDTAMRRRGAEGTAFETIVASGPNSAKPHHRPDDREIRAGDAVVIDFGATFDGYRSDMTRTFCVGGEPEGELARVIEVVARSQKAGVASVRAGAGAKDVDQVCRDIIVDAGWGEAFEHGTGHGVGLDIHEAPSVSPLGTAILSPGTVVTVEPGVYLPGIGGVRIEDTLVVTDDGSRALTNFTKDVIV
ncbi:MAG: aminopeptidase P family protein [Actinomycetota bacterium]|nr:aminopeptidase P family protein [Actinomycetota bacterium]